MTDADAPDASVGSKPELRFIVCGASASAALSFETDTRRLVG